MAERAFPTIAGDACAVTTIFSGAFVLMRFFPGKFESGAIIAGKAATAHPRRIIIL